MNYETAKRLKDAGFQNRVDINRVYIEDIPVPTLEELIEACGDRFYGLVRTPEGFDVVGYPRGTPSKHGMYPVTFSAKTPSEAVANLWLAINK